MQIYLEDVRGAQLSISQWPPPVTSDPASWARRGAGCTLM